MFGDLIKKLLGQDQPGIQRQGTRDASELPQGIQTFRDKNKAPFKMFEDNSFQGNPNRFLQTNPRFKFYEDNSFSAPPQLGVGNSDGYGQMDDSQVINPQGWASGVREGYLTNPMRSQDMQGSLSDYYRLKY